ncbi:L-threonine 3-dehydrogenase, partial [Corynebacterium amycolatum]
MCIRTQSVGVQRDGAFAEYVVIPESNVWVHTDDFVTPELGAIFDPLGNATHTALLNNLVGEDVLITGAGPIGLMSAAIARHAGARKIVVTDLNEERLKLVEGMG